MAILKYLGIVFYAARAARAETERTPLVPLVSIRELHEDFSGKVEDAKCEDKPELVNSHEDILVGREDARRRLREPRHAAGRGFH